MFLVGFQINVASGVDKHDQPKTEQPKKCVRLKEQKAKLMGGKLERSYP